MKDYYSILHVLPSAEIDVIKAAYKALARKYHPDTFDGDKAYAGKRMQEINDAFGIIGDPDKRKKYDAERERDKPEDDFSSNDNDIDVRLEEDWKFACKNCPEARACFDHLNKLSRTLAFAFKSYLLESKQFSECRTLTERFRTEFLLNYFGSNPILQALGEDLILTGRIDAARAVNRAVKIMGASLNIDNLYETLETDFHVLTARPKRTDQSPASPKRTDHLTSIQQLFVKAQQHGNYTQFEELLTKLDIPFTVGLTKYKVTYQRETVNIPFVEVPKWTADTLGRIPMFHNLVI